MDSLELSELPVVDALPGTAIRSARGGVIHVVQPSETWDGLLPRLMRAFPLQASWPMVVEELRHQDQYMECRLIIRPQVFDEVEQSDTPGQTDPVG